MAAEAFTNLFRDQIMHTMNTIRSCWGSSQGVTNYERVFSKVLIVFWLMLCKRKALRTVR